MLKRIRRYALEFRSLRELREIRDTVNALIQEVEQGPRREIDIADAHTGDPAFIHEVKWETEWKAGRQRRCELIYCSSQRCPECPHGSFIFKYRRNLRKKTREVMYVGRPVLDLDALDEMRRQHSREPVFRGRIRPIET